METWPLPIAAAMKPAALRRSSPIWPVFGGFAPLVAHALAQRARRQPTMPDAALTSVHLYRIVTGADFRQVV